MDLKSHLPMQIKPLREDLVEYLTKHQLEKKFTKQSALFENNPRHPSLHTERLEPKQLKLYSFRIDRKFRAVFIFIDTQTIEIVDINDHYQ